MRARDFVLSSVPTLALLVASGAAQAQSISTASIDAGAPNSDTAQANPVKFELLAGADKKEASVKIRLFDSLSNDLKKGGSSFDQSRQLTVTLSTPWDGENDAVPASLDKLASGTKIKFEFAFFGMETRNSTTPRQNEFSQKARRICISKANEGYAQRLGALGPTPNQESITAVNKTHAETISNCETDDSNSVITAFSKDDLPAYTRENLIEAGIGFSLDASIGHNKFEYIDPTNLTKQSVSKASWSAGASVRKYFASAPVMVSLSADYQSGYKEGDKTIFCPVAVGPAPVVCIQGSAGAPVHQEGAVIRFNLRSRLLQKNGKSLLAVSPLVSYDTSEDVWGAELPIYFIPGKDDSLTGGIKVGYRSDKKDVTFGLFIGAAFGM